MRVEYPCATTDEVIRGLVDAAPEFTPAQLNRIRVLLHAAAPESLDA